MSDQQKPSSKRHEEGQGPASLTTIPSFFSSRTQRRRTAVLRINERRTPGGSGCASLLLFRAQVFMGRMVAIQNSPQTNL
jgi:hypothetical protein